MQFNLQLIYPSYLNKTNETVSNSGDLQIPQGTKVNWVFNTKNTDHLQLRFSDSLATPVRNTENQFNFSRRFMQSNSYTIKASNKFVGVSPDSVNYSINVVPDQYPIIDVSEKADSLNPRTIYFSGQIKDDYGFSSLFFHYKKFGTDSSGKKSESSGTYPVSFNKGQISQAYFYFFDASQFKLQPGDKIEYFFEVRDNDGVNGAKSSKTQIMAFKAPTKEELNESTAKNNTEIKKDLEESIKKAKQLQKDVNELSKKINDKKQLGYEEKKKLEEMLKKQNELKNQIENIKEENKINNQQQNEFNQVDENILEKQKQLEQLFENIMTPEMKKLFEELSKMMEKLDKNEVQQKLDELKLTNKDLEKELDRNLEAFKHLELEQKMMQAMEKLEELKNKEDELNKATENNDNKNKDDKNSKDLEQKQQEIQKEFDKLKEDLKDIEKKNSELEEPKSLPKLEQKQNEVSKEMQNSSQQLGKNNKKDASKSQKNASEKMQEMMDEMEKAMEEEEEQQEEENAQTLRQILENLLNLSFAQEELMKLLPKTRIDNPQYVKIPQQQNKLKDDSKIIEDSLLALSKRAPQISALVNREISAINMNMDKTVKALAERNTGESGMRMQSTMTSVNNLALLLNESLEQMQKQMKEKKQQKSKPGSGKCKKPGSGDKPSPSQSMPNMRQLQQQLNQQLQQLKDAMEKGQKPGDKPGDKNGQKPGSKPGQNPGGMNLMPGSSEQLAKLAAQQEALRRQMEALMEKMKNKGKNPGGDIANMMEQTEKDIVNKQISNETMKRQQEILTRLLESEKAEKEREQDEQRKSNEAKNENISNPGRFLEYKRLKEKELELLNTVPPSLTPYYKEKVNNYFNSVNK
jgi:hypothetical protein